MRRIVDRVRVTDTEGNVWEAWVTIPWVDRGDDEVRYGPGKSHGPLAPRVQLHTPDDPEHWAYGEDGPTFDDAELRGLMAVVDAAKVEATEEAAGRES